jgi:glyoxylase-like metal-dependent hydrolase (beta-lactamase superfamily II)/rhodanese-related sulfurtransferase
MYIQQLYTKCLAEAAYYIESDGEVAIIDPLRDISEYLELAKRRSAKIKYVFETHFHADFVSGHVELAKATGATIVFGPTTLKPGFEAVIAQDGQLFSLGNIQFQLIHTPGHTMESSCFLLSNEAGSPYALFTGDTLFIDDVGRPDLAQKVIAELTQEKLAAHLFDSLRNKIMPLPDDLIIYPGHGAGSACGKKMSNETTDTLGHQKKNNYALDLKLSKEEFIEKVLDGLMPPPAYFPQDVLLNLGGYDTLDHVYRKAKATDPAHFQEIISSTDILVIDTRSADVFAKGFIPHSINIGLDGQFAVWAGTIIRDVAQKIALVCEPGTEKEVLTRLSRVGFDHTIAYLFGGFEAWKKEGRNFETIRSVSVDDFVEQFYDEKAVILDVRKASEYDSQHIDGAINVPLDYVFESKLKIQADKTYYVHCAAGYRSMIFVSILQAEGYKNLVNVNGGFTAIKNSNKFSFTAYHEPATML